MKSLFSPPALLLAALVVAPPAHAAEPVVTLHRALLEREIQRIFVPSSVDPRIGYRGDVTVSRRSTNSLWINIPLRRDDGIHFSLKVGFEFLCAHGRLFANSHDVDFQSGDFRSWFASRVPGVENRIEVAVAEGLDANVFPAIPLDRECPGIEVLSDGALRFDFGGGGECQLGETRRQACRAGTTGAGITLRCGNGRWEISSYGCETQAPPSGPQL